MSRSPLLRAAPTRTVTHRLAGRRAPLAALAAALAALAPALSPAPPALAQTPDWTATTAATEGGHRLGNPEAATTLVTFVSYSCPHCASFERQSDEVLRNSYVRSGHLSLEVRHMIRNPIDLAAVLATECGASDGFFERHRAMMLGHEAWMAKAVAAPREQQQRWASGGFAERMQAISGDLGFPALLRPHGLSAAALDRCLADEGRAVALAEAAQAQSRRYAIPGTPSFVVDGRLLEGVHTWGELRRTLDARR